MFRRNSQTLFDHWCENRDQSIHFDSQKAFRFKNISYVRNNIRFLKGFVNFVLFTKLQDCDIEY